MDDVVAEVRQHWRIIMQSGGGVTCGGGEALGQPVFLKALLKEFHEEVGFHTCLDTCGHGPWSVLESILPFTDMILLDLKHMDEAKHRASTGQGNTLILDNATRLARSDVTVLVRLPLIPGFNDDEENLHALGAFMRLHGLPVIEILPYHGFGVSKHQALGKVYTLYTREKPQADRAESILLSYGLEVDVARRNESRK